MKNKNQHGLYIGETRLKGLVDFRKLKQVTRYQLNDFRLEQLKNSYDSITCELNSIYKPETSKTVEEHVINQKLKAYTKLMFKRSFWIGSRNIDFFFPYLAGDIANQGSRFKGLVIEVDGPIHNQQRKMSRDCSKYKQLHDLGIGVYTIENEDININTFTTFLSFLSKCPRIDNRAKNRLMRNIYLKTIYENKEIVKDLDLRVANLVIQIIDGEC